MNKRIQELALQAGAGRRAGVGGLVFRDNELEKFAELIVLECERVAKNPKWYSESPSDGWRNPIRHVCDEMKENFGVK